MEAQAVSILRKQPGSGALALDCQGHGGTMLWICSPKRVLALMTSALLVSTVFIPIAACSFTNCVALSNVQLVSKESWKPRIEAAGLISR